MEITVKRFFVTAMNFLNKFYVFCFQMGAVLDSSDNLLPSTTPPPQSSVTDLLMQLVNDFKPSDSSSTEPPSTDGES